MNCLSYHIVRATHLASASSIFQCLGERSRRAVERALRVRSPLPRGGAVQVDYGKLALNGRAYHEALEFVFASEFNCIYASCRLSQVQGDGKKREHSGALFSSR